MGLERCEEFEIAIGDDVLGDLRDRLERTKWAKDFSNEDWRYGVESSYLRELVDYWLDGYDWRSQEKVMNSYSHYRVTLDGVPIHFIHEPGVGDAPMPIIVSHGWPWSFWDLERVIGPLANPEAHGGDPADAFEVVVPSLPGFGFSGPLTKPGINFWNTADLWSELMSEVLGHQRYAAQGGDFGALITAQLGHKYPDEIIGAHMTLTLPLSLFGAFSEAPGFNGEGDAPKHVPMGFPGPELYDEDDRHRLEWMIETDSMSTVSSHTAVQTNDAQTLGYALQDSPVGLAAWLVQRRRHWSDNEGNVEEAFSKDELINLTMLYWATETVTTSFRYYWEGAHNLWSPERDSLPVVVAPTGVALYAKEPFKPPNAWLNSYYNLHRLTEMSKGGHFAPAEVPELWVEDVREFYRPLR